MSPRTSVCCPAATQKDTLQLVDMSRIKLPETESSVVMLNVVAFMQSWSPPPENVVGLRAVHWFKGVLWLVWDHMAGGSLAKMLQVVRPFVALSTACSAEQGIGFPVMCEGL